MNDHINCGCKELIHQVQLVVMTGGPGAGKTAVLEIAKKNLCEYIAVLPEAASIVFGGGFWRRETLPAQKGAQRAIYKVQRELERVVIEEAQTVIALCDRGTLDGLAYWPESPETFFSEIGTSRAEELRRYSAVIHLRTPGPNQGYNYQNPMRIESAERAAQIDARIEMAWEGHPNRFFIGSDDDFLIKAQRAMEAIKALLPPCCQKHRIRELEKASKA